MHNDLIVLIVLLIARVIAIYCFSRRFFFSCTLLTESRRVYRNKQIQNIRKEHAADNRTSSQPVFLIRRAKKPSKMRKAVCNLKEASSAWHSRRTYDLFLPLKAFNSRGKC